MERKIGEIFEHDGEWYQCVEDYEKTICANCDLYNGGHKKCTDETHGNCRIDNRKDGKSVCFKKLEKVGEPFPCSYYGDNRLIIMQEYHAYDNNIASNEGIPMYFTDEKHTRIAIAIKQNQEDMEENKLNLKPFDLEAARSGKPVCTRNGKKARIICFDRKGYNIFPIVALIMNDDKESDIYTYRPNGTWDNNGNESDKDLMMIPEKHEGWINIYKTDNDKYAALIGSAYLYKTEKEAKIDADPDTVLATVKIEWEE